MLTLVYQGRDSRERPVYECDGKLYVDANPRKNWVPEICTKLNNEFDGEPYIHVKSPSKIKFVPQRYTWD